MTPSCENCTDISSLWIHAHIVFFGTIKNILVIYFSGNKYQAIPKLYCWMRYLEYVILVTQFHGFLNQTNYLEPFQFHFKTLLNKNWLRINNTCSEIHYASCYWGTIQQLLVLLTLVYFWIVVCANYSHSEHFESLMIPNLLFAETNGTSDNLEKQMEQIIIWKRMF